MPEYIVWALVDPVENELGPYSPLLSANQARKRIRAGFEKLQAALVRITSGFSVVKECPDSATIFIAAPFDIADELRSLDLCFIAYGPGRKYPIGGRHLFYVRASVGAPPDTQEKILQVIKREFDAEPGREAFTFFIPGDPDAQWLPDPKERRRAWFIQMQKLQRVLDSNGLRAEIGVS